MIVEWLPYILSSYLIRYQLFKVSISMNIEDDIERSVAIKK